MVKGLAAGAVGALAVGGLAAGAAAVGVPAATITGVLFVAGAVSGAVGMYSTAGHFRDGQYAGAAFDVSALVGGSFGGKLIGGRVGDAIKGPASRGFSLRRFNADRYRPSLGSPRQWLSTGPDEYATAGGLAGMQSGPTVAWNLFNGRCD